MDNDVDMNNDFFLQHGGEFPDPFKGLNTTGTGAGERGKRGGRLGQMVSGFGNHVSNAFHTISGGHRRAVEANKAAAYDEYTDKNPFYYSQDRSLPEPPAPPF